MFNKLGLIENYGSGIQRIVEAYPNADVDKLFPNFGTFFRVVLPDMNYSETQNTISNDIVNDTVNNTVNDTVNTKLSIMQKLIIDIIDKKQSTTLSDMAKQLNIGRATVARNIKKLQELGIIKREGSDKTGYWTIEYKK